MFSSVSSHSGNGWEGSSLTTPFLSGPGCHPVNLDVLHYAIMPRFFWVPGGFLAKQWSNTSNFCSDQTPCWWMILMAVVEAGCIHWSPSLGWQIASQGNSSTSINQWLVISWHFLSVLTGYQWYPVMFLICRSHCFCYHLVNVYITMENPNAMNGKTHEISMAIFNSKLSVITRG